MRRSVSVFVLAMMVGGCGPSGSVPGPAPLRSSAAPDWERTGNRFWLVAPRNALDVVFEDGLFATRLEMVVRGDGLVGNRHVYGDVPSSPPTVQPAAGVREPCPAGVAAAAP